MFRWVSVEYKYWWRHRCNISTRLLIRSINGIVFKDVTPNSLVDVGYASISEECNIFIFCSEDTVARSSEPSAYTYQSTRRHVPENWNLHGHHQEKPKAHILSLALVHPYFNYRPIRILWGTVWEAPMLYVLFSKLSLPTFLKVRYLHTYLFYFEAIVDNCDHLLMFSILNQYCKLE